jgi:hypothetical protein
MNLGSCGKQSIDHRDRAFRTHRAPFIGDGAVDRQHAIGKSDIDLFQPPFQCRGLRWIMPSCQLDPFADLTGDEHAQIHLVVFD